MAGRPRKPTELHIISGSAAKHPDRMRGRESEPAAEGGDLRDARPPRHIKGPLAKIWKEMQGHLHARVASAPDAIAFEVLVRLIDQMRHGEMGAADYSRLQSMLGEFGMTPASRSKVTQGKAPEAKKGFAALKGTG